MGSEHVIFAVEPTPEGNPATIIRNVETQLDLTYDDFYDRILVFSGLNGFHGQSLTTELGGGDGHKHIKRAVQVTYHDGVSATGGSYWERRGGDLERVDSLHEEVPGMMKRYLDYFSQEYSINVPV